ncbi:MAG: AAA family ATPase [Clostridia bacterium]|nr:AAA family ATPase [Clostridia bacterium]
MVILIGGVSCTGKTALAQRLLERHYMSVLSIDHLKMGLIRGWPECGFSAEDSDDAIAEKLWPVLEGIVRTCVENGQHLIVEGCYLPPERVRLLCDALPGEIVAVYIGLSEGYIERHFEDGLLAHRNRIERRGQDEDRPSDWFRAAHRRMKQRCLENGLPHFWIAEDYDAEMWAVEEWIDRQLDELR